MRIPIENIYYLLCYAWDVLDEKEVVSVEPVESPSLVDLLARVLISGTNHLVKRGFDRGYVPASEWTGRLRGRILFQDAIRLNRARGVALPCKFDELSHDVLHNQILKATITRLRRVDGLTRDTTDGLVALRRRLASVSDINITTRAFGQVQLHRNNRFYDFLLRVCELVHNNLLPSEQTGRSKFRNFVEDEVQMRTVFEEFVRRFYRLHTSYRVQREDIRWKWIAADAVAAGLLPKMQTDVSLTSASRKIIIECKFTPEATKRHYEVEKLRREHLFQIYAYLGNLREGPFAETCEMILLYPTVGQVLLADYNFNQHKIGIRTIDLDQPWQRVHDGLLALVG